MANEEHVAILKQGVEVWNRWRYENPDVEPDFRNADLGGSDLRNADLRGSVLRAANLRGADLRGADLTSAYLIGASLIDAQLRRTNLRSADLNRADLRNASLQEAILAYVDIGRTRFASNDLSTVIGLETVRHSGPSDISTNTLSTSGQLPEVFLRGCGMSDWEIESTKLYNPDLSNEEINNIYYRIHDLRVSRAFQINPLFISYSHDDTAFVDAIEKCLIERGIRFWRDIHHARAGRLEKQIDQAIHLNDVVLLVLSFNSTESDWVEHEARKAREKEKQTGKDALCPVALDNSWKTCRWPERLREQIEEYNILDFSNWQDAATFQRMFGKLLEGLNLFYK